MTTPPTPEPGDPAPRKLTRDEAIARLAERYRALVAPGQVVELRALKVRRGSGRPHTEAGFFDAGHLAEMARAALDLTDLARGVYFTLNPLNPEVLARRCNRTDWADEGELAKDKDVLARRWLLVDADPVRDPHVSATDVEKGRALDTARAVRAFLGGRGWPDPVLGDSGNGYHLLYRVDLPADDGGLVKRALEALAARFDTECVTIDRSVHNPGRICKLPGTLARKGDSTDDRPHRRARLLEIPDPCVPVPRERLDSLASEAPAPAAPPVPPHVPAGDRGTSGRFAARLCVDRWLADRGVAFRAKPEPDARGRTVYVLGACPFDPGHADPDACVMQAPDGALSAHCFHNGCAGRGWQAFKARIGPPGPDHYDPPRSTGARGCGRRNNRPSAPGPDRSDRPADPTSPPPPAGPAPEGPPAADGPPSEGPPAPPAPAGAGGARPVVAINAASTPVARTMAAITDVFVAAGDCYRRAGQLVRVTDGTIAPVLSAPELAGLLNHFAEVQVVNEDGGEYRPLISNVGSFGEGVFKIGMTRRRVPQDRVDELGDASVPFPFDVHAMISCADAPALEAALHRRFGARRVNRVNPRKEFFRVGLDEIIAAVRAEHGEVEYRADAEALEYLSSRTATDADLAGIEGAFADAEGTILLPRPAGT